MFFAFHRFDCLCALYMVPVGQDKEVLVNFLGQDGCFTKTRVSKDNLPPDSFHSQNLLSVICTCFSTLVCPIKRNTVEEVLSFCML